VRALALRSSIGFESCTSLERRVNTLSQPVHASEVANFIESIVIDTVSSSDDQPGQQQKSAPNLSTSPASLADRDEVADLMWPAELATMGRYTVVSRVVIGDEIACEVAEQFGRRVLAA